ncbi:MAG: D-alanyl-D-alanine carboxypeptidase family protein [Oscillospiraceae bacterium]|nr:D-alanyl-D-alanine carboxypeptidase family protein [Oscillospiraceae bacterium]
MKTKTKILLPILLILIIAASCAGGWYWYDNNVDRSGWVEKDGIRFYQDFHADPVSGWLELPEGRYYFHADGTPHTGWQSVDGITYYFGTDGIMHTGWLELDGKLHYFGGNGAMVEGWLWLQEGRYYLKEGVLLTGWQEIDDQTYYFDEDGIVAMGFTQIEDNWYYFEDGIMATGLTEVEQQVYNFGTDGIQITGWTDSDDGRRYFSPDGPMATGWQEIDGSRYFFTEEGLMYIGWMEVGEYKYYFHEDGRSAVGPTVIGGDTHYFTPKGIEVVLVNALNPVPEWYCFDPVNVVDYHDVDRLCYDALIRMLGDLTEAGIEYTFNSAYRSILEQTTILEYRTREHMKNFDLEFNEARDKAYETVAVPGTSEHHLGLAVDLLGTEAVAWLTEHCWDYGFIVRYTEEKEPITGIVDEPWHFRYVGTEVSLDMKGSGLCLEEYLGADAVTWDKVTAKYGDELYTETVWKEPDPKPAETTAAAEVTQ